MPAGQILPCQNLAFELLPPPEVWAAQPDQIVRDVIRGQILAVESYYHGTDVFAGRYTNHRLLRSLGNWLSTALTLVLISASAAFAS